MENNFEVLLVIFLLTTGVGGYLLLKAFSKIKFYENKYSKIIDIEKEVKSQKDKKDGIALEIDDLRSSYKEKKTNL